MTELIPTLTQSGLLAVLLQRQRYRVLQLAWRRAHRSRLLAAFWNILISLFRVLTAPRLVKLGPIFRGNRPATLLNL